MENQTEDRWAERGAVAITGPAISPRRPPHAGAAPHLGEPLPPFVRPRSAANVPESARPATGAEGAEPPVLEPEVLDLVEAELEASQPEAADHEESAPETEEVGGDLPWLSEELTPSARGDDELGLVRGADWGLADDDFEVEITDLLLEERAPSEPEPPREVAPAEPQEAQADAAQDPSATPLEAAAPDAQAEWALAASVASASEGDAASEAEPAAEAEGPVPPAPGMVQRMESALAEVMGAGEGEALEEVAGRLERIALALREGRPIELFASGATDPLEVLVAGYALGYSEAFRRVGAERRGGR
jgi:hypothetical protein